MNTAANDPTTAFWQTLRDFVVQAFSLFGAPHEIAQRGATLRKPHQLLLHYLRQCETLLRKLLFIEALALMPTLNSGLPACSRQGRIRKRRTHEQDPENSETWRVTFRVSPPAPSLSHSRASRSDEPGTQGIVEQSVCSWVPDRTSGASGMTSDGGVRSKTPGRFVSTWPAAERFEALIRAFNNPAPHIKRLARILKRRAHIIRAYFLRTPPRTYGKSVLEEPIRAVTLLARQRYKDSS